jgi:hypothetical protein
MTQKTAPGKNWRVILTLLVSIAGILFFLVQAFFLGLFGLISILDPSSSLIDRAPISLYFWVSLFGAFLLIPLLMLSISYLRGKPSIGWLDLKKPALTWISRWVIILWPLLVFLGWGATKIEGLSTLLLGPINLLVAGIPILWIYAAAQRGLEGGSQIRKWWIFGFSIAFLPIIIITIELIAVVFLGGAGAIGLAFRFYNNPQIEQQLMQWIDQIQSIAFGQDLDALLDVLKPFLLQPSVIFWGIASFGGIFPIIEETIKPLALWPMAGRNITEQEGFVGGLLCGAGFALMENVLFFTNVSQPEEWLFMAIGRAGTGVLHMLASGLIGWGLARAWRDGKWAFLGLTTLGSFFLHGLWNTIAVITGGVPLLFLETEPALGQTLLFQAPIILFLLISVVGLVLLNKHLQKKTVETASIGENTL